MRLSVLPWFFIFVVSCEERFLALALRKVGRHRSNATSAARREAKATRGRSGLFAPAALVVRRQRLAASRIASGSAEETPGDIRYPRAHGTLVSVNSTEAMTAQAHEAHNLAWFVARTADMYKEVVSWLVTIERNDMAALLFALVILCYFVKVMYFDLPRAPRSTELWNATKKEVDLFFSHEVDEMLTSLQEIQANSVHLAERHFQDKYRNMVKQMKEGLRLDFSRTPEFLVSRFRDFVCGYLHTFHQCSLDPQDQPNIVCSQEKMRNTTSIKELCTVVLQESEGKMLDLAKAEMVAVDDLNMLLAESRALIETVEQNQAGTHWIRMRCTSLWCKRPSRGGGLDKGLLVPVDIGLFFLQLNLFSMWQAGLLLSFLFGFSTMSSLHWRGKHHLGHAVGLSVCLLVLILYKVRVLHRSQELEQATQQLQKHHQEATHIYMSMRKALGQYSQVVKLWRYQTMNLLDLWDEHVQFCINNFNNPDMRWGQVTKIHDRLLAAREGMGGTSLYMGKQALNEETLAYASSQMKHSINRIGEAYDRKDYALLLKLYDNFCCFLAVNVVGSHNLPDLPGGVQVSLAIGKRKHSQHLEQDLDLACTRSIAGSRNPMWREGFELPVQMGEDIITIEVFATGDESSALSLSRSTAAASRSTVATSRNLGFAEVPFRGCPGRWISKTTNLTVLDPSANGSTVEVELFFGTCIQHYAFLSSRSLPNMESLGHFLA